MKTITVKSKRYTRKNVQFGKFLMKFDLHGLAKIDVENDEEEAELNKIVSEYSPFINFLEGEAAIEFEAEKEKNVKVLQSVISAKDKEIKVLKITNDQLATENTSLKGELKAYKNIEKNDENDKVDNSNTNIDKNNNTVTELQTKTISELKDILNSVFGEFNSEWKTLTKKDDIINYIIKKSNV